MIINKKNYSVEYMNDYFFTQFKAMLKNDGKEEDQEDPTYYNFILDMKVFEQYKSECPTLMSIRDILENDMSQNKKLVWVFTQEYIKEDKYYTINIKDLVGENNNSVMITIIDSTHQIQFNNEKSYNDTLKSINATVNHELRNPLNSISAFTM